MTYEVNEVNTYEHKTTDINLVVDKYKHLRKDESYRTLHCWFAHRIGSDRYEGLAKEAERYGKQPAKYFTYLLKKSCG